VELEHLKIKTRLTNEKFVSVKVCDIKIPLRLTLKDSSLLAYLRLPKKLVYYESMKRKIKIKPLYECRGNGRLQTQRFTCLSHTGLVVELEHLKIKTRLTNEKFVSVKGECEI
jgi:hypothetical protein